ncbi:MAG: hypothetical protein AAF217_11135 [Pseudomonadota bacterium]
MFNKYLKDGGNSLVLCAEMDGRMIGMLHCSIGEHFISEGTLLANVSAIYVEVRTRQTLLGGRAVSKLIRGVSKWAKANSADMLIFNVANGIHIAKTNRFFHKLGATPLGGNYAVRL